jgi:membrane protease YdiL (CAAX protease family)
LFQKQSPLVATLEALAVIAICFGISILVSLAAVVSGYPSDGQFSDGSFVNMILWESVLGGAALALLRSRGYSLADILPTPSWRGSLIGGVLFLPAVGIGWAIAQVFSESELASQPIETMMARSGVSLPLVFAGSVLNGTYEETFVLGYLIRRFRESGPAFAIGVSLLVRTLYHLYQGPIGALTVFSFGLVLSLFYWVTGRLWPVVVAHILADIVAFV